MSVRERLIVVGRLFSWPLAFGGVMALIYFSLPVLRPQISHYLSVILVVTVLLAIGQWIVRELWHH